MPLQFDGKSQMFHSQRYALPLIFCRLLSVQLQNLEVTFISSNCSSFAKASLWMPSYLNLRFLRAFETSLISSPPASYNSKQGLSYPRRNEVVWLKKCTLLLVSLRVLNAIFTHHDAPIHIVFFGFALILQINLVTDLVLAPLLWERILFCIIMIIYNLSVNCTYY